HARRDRLEHLDLHAAAPVERKQKHRETAQELGAGLHLAENAHTRSGIRRKIPTPAGDEELRVRDAAGDRGPDAVEEAMAGRRRLDPFVAPGCLSLLEMEDVRVGSLALHARQQRVARELAAGATKLVHA